MSERRDIGDCVGSGLPVGHFNPSEARYMPHRRTEPVEPASLQGRMRRCEGRSGELLRVQPICTALRRISSHRERSRQRLRFEVIPEARHVTLRRSRTGLHFCGSPDRGRIPVVHRSPPVGVRIARPVPKGASATRVWAPRHGDPVFLSLPAAITAAAWHSPLPTTLSPGSRPPKQGLRLRAILVEFHFRRKIRSLAVPVTSHDVHCAGIRSPGRM